MSACAAHCLLAPLAVGVLPLIGLGVFASAWFEWSMIAAATLMGGTGLWISYAHAHRSARPAKVFVAGISVIVAGQLLLDHGDILHAAAAVGGGVMMFVAGRLNHNCATHEKH
jgi:hypothetical protein